MSCVHGCGVRRALLLGLDACVRQVTTTVTGAWRIAVGNVWLVRLASLATSGARVVLILASTVQLGLMETALRHVRTIQQVWKAVMSCRTASVLLASLIPTEVLRTITLRVNRVQQVFLAVKQL